MAVVSYMLVCCKPGKVLRPIVLSVDAARMAAKLFRHNGWVVTVLSEVAQ